MDEKEKENSPNLTADGEIPAVLRDIPDGFYMGTVKLGPKGQIVIPKEVREMFGVGPGDTLILLADRRRGVALQKREMVQPLVDGILKGVKEQGEDDGQQ